MTGEAGIGKTRLLRELCDARLHGRNRHAVHGYEMERMVPLAAAAGLLESLIDVAGEGVRLAALLGDTAQPGDRLRLFEAARRCIVAEPPTIVVVDDLQWVDEISVALVHYLLRAAVSANLPLAFLVATRPGDAVFAFAEAAGRVLDGPDRVSIVDLGPLDREDGVRLVFALIPDLGAVAAEGLWERSGGSPFWLTTAVQRADPTGRSELGLRLRTMDADALELTALLTLSPAPSAIQVLRKIFDWPEPRWKAAVDALARRGLVGVTDTTIALVHDVVRDAALGVLTPQQVRLAHGRLAEHLRGSAQDDVQTLRRALSHELAAGRDGADLALDILRARHRGLLGEADLAEFGIIANTREANGDRSAAHRLHAELARVSAELGRPDMAADHWQWLTLDASTQLAAARSALFGSIAALLAGDRPRALSLLAMVNTGDLSDPALLARYHAHLSELHGDSTAASEEPMRRATDLAIGLAQANGGVQNLTPDARTGYLAAYQAAYYFELRNDRPLGMLAHADQMARASDTVETRLRASLLRVLPLRLLARYAEAESTARTVRVAAVREQFTGLAFLSGYLQALCLYSLGRLEAARAAAVDSGALADRAPVVVPSWLSAAWIHALIPEITVSTDGWAAAQPAFDKLIDAEPNPHFRLHIRTGAAQWASRLGGADVVAQAALWAEDGAHDAAIAGCLRCAAEQHLRSAEVYARVGRPEKARTLLDTWDRDHPTPIGQANLWRARAEGLVDLLCHPDRAAPSLDRARSVAAEAGAKLELVWCDLDLGAALADTEPLRAIEVLHRTADEAAAIGAGSEERRAQQMLRRLGVRTWRPSRPVSQTPNGLTERELSIAQMICDGATNPEIAEALFLSRKTVERHVSNVLAKTGTRNRAELAARFPVRPTAGTLDHRAR